MASSNNSGASVWARLRATFGYGAKAKPADRLGGYNSPHGRIDPDIGTVTAESLPYASSFQGKYQWVAFSSSNVFAIRYVPHIETDFSNATVKRTGFGRTVLVPENVEADDGTLFIAFRAKTNSANAGSVYMYNNFPETLYMEMLTAGSKGHFVWEEIRNKYYPDGGGNYRKVSMQYATDYTG